MDLLNLVNEHRYEDLFVDELFWDSGDYREPLQISLEKEDGGSEIFTLENVANAENIRVFVCDQLPSRTVQAKIAAKVAQKSTHYFVIFHDGAAQQTWRWPAQVLRGDRASVKLTSHEHTRGLLNPKLVKRLEAIRLIPGEKLSVTQMYDKIQAAFDTETADETKKASQLMVDLFESLEEAGLSENHISETLARILFVMFGDDTEMWGAGNENLFERFIEEHTAEDGSDFAERLNNLFVFLDTKPRKEYELAAEGRPAELKGFRYVNGGIFSNPQPLPASVGQKFREAVLRACRTDWADISPAIFGSMFQSVRDAATRRAMGEHYTSEKDILKTLNPLFLDDLRGVFHSARGKSDEPKRLRDLRQRLSRIKFMDPACGCGNFVIIAYRELRALELAIVASLVELGKISGNEAGFALDVASPLTPAERASLLEPMVVIDNFYGIEIDPWPAAIARTAMFLIERQSDQLMNEKFGYAPARLPIRQESHIVTADALRTDWHEVLPAGADDEVYVAGNPPFIGQANRSADQTAALKGVWGASYDGYLDFVTGWFKKSIDYFKDHESKGKEFAFVSTNSIAQGQAVPALFGHLFEAGWRLKFAYQTFPWSAEAAVHCVITGFTQNQRAKQRLWSYSFAERDSQEVEVENAINAYLLDGPNVLVRKRTQVLSPEITKVTRGSQPTDNGNLIVEVEEYEEVSQDPIAAKYLRPFRMGKELVRGLDRWCLWLVDATEEEIKSSPVMIRRVDAVRQFRLASKKLATQRKASTPHLFDENKQPLQDYVGIPRVVSEDRLYFTVAHLKPAVIAGDKVYTAIDPDGFLFAIISSSVFVTWQKAIGGRLESRLSFSNTVVWNNLPLPPVATQLRQQIIEAGKQVLEERERINREAGKTVGLATMYKPDAMPADLVAAHDSLDALVDQAFGAKQPLASNDERLHLLFAQYAKMIAAEEKAKAVAPAKKTRARASR